MKTGDIVKGLPSSGNEYFVEQMNVEICKGGVILWAVAYDRICMEWRGESRK